MENVSGTRDFKSQSQAFKKQSRFKFNKAWHMINMMSRQLGLTKCV